MTVPLTLVLTFEGLATAPLGCYGCSWNQTPAFDAIAARGAVWDRWTSPIDSPSGLIRDWLTNSAAIIERCRASGSTHLLTDDRQLDLTERDLGFDELTRLDFVPPEHPAEQLDDTLASKAIAATIDQASPNASLIWLHSSLLRDVWDAPIEVEEEAAESRVDDEFRDENTDQQVASFELPTNASVPSLQLKSDDDPDRLFAWMNRYAAQVRLIDSMIDLLRMSLAHLDPRILIAGSSGFSLGQNGWLGHRVGPLRSSELRLPMITSMGGPIRCPGLQSAAEFHTVLERLLNNEKPIAPDAWTASCSEFEPLVLTESDRARAAVTSAQWFLVDSQDKQCLFLKPDDLDDANDVSRLRPEVIDELLERSTAPEN